MLDSNLQNSYPKSNTEVKKEQQKEPIINVTQKGLDAVNRTQDFVNKAKELNMQQNNAANANANPYAQFAAQGVNLGTSEKGGLNLERYYNRGAYKELGFNPFIDNELKYQKNTTRWDDFTVSLGQSWNLAKLGFTSLWSSETDVEKAERYQRYANIGTSQREGAISRNFNNLVLNAGYTVGLLAEIALEEALIGFATGGLGTPVVLGKSFAKAKNLSSAQKYMNAPFRTMNAIQDIKNPSKAKAMWESTRKAAANVFPFTNTVENITTWNRQMERLADGSLRAVGAEKKAIRTFGAFYRDGREIALALDESKLESGFAKNKVIDDLILQYQEENNGALPNDEEFSMMMEKADEAGRRAYWTNAFVIYGSNKVTFGNMFNKFQPRILRTGSTVTSPVAGGKLVKDFSNYTLDYIKSTGMFNIKGKAKEIGKDISSLFTVSGIKKAPGATLGKALKYTKANFSEGVQEYLQEVIQEAETERAKDRYKQTVRGSILENATESKSTFDYYSGSFGKMWSAEGAEIFGSGFLMGFVAGPAGSVVGGVPSSVAKMSDYLRKSKAERELDANFIKAQQEKIQKKVDQFNEMTNPEKDFLIKYMNHTAKQAEYAANMEQTADNKDAKGFYDIKDESLAENILNAINLGAYDLFLEKVENLAQMSEEDLRDAFKPQLADPDDTSISSFKTRSDEVVEATRMIKDFYDNNDKIFPEVADYGLEDSEFDMGITMKDLREARQSYIQYLTLNQFTLVRAIQRRKKLQEALLGEKSPFNEVDKIGPSSITHLMSDQMTAQEIKLLRDEISMLEGYDKLDTQQKAELKQKKQSLESLTEIQKQILEYTKKVSHKEAVLEFQKKAKTSPDTLIGQQINYRTTADGKDKVGKITGVSFDENNVASFEVEYQDEKTQKYITETVKNDSKLIKELEADPDTVLKASVNGVYDSMKKYLKVIAKRNDTTVDATKVNDFLSAFIDARILSLDEAMLANAVETLVMPENHVEYIKQYNARMKRYRERMAETISSDLSAFYNSKDVADLLEVLANEYSVFIAQEDLEKLIGDFTSIPENLYDLKTILPLSQDTERYKKAIEKVQDWSEIKTTQPTTTTTTTAPAASTVTPAPVPAPATVTAPTEPFVKLSVSAIQNGTVSLPAPFIRILEKEVAAYNEALGDVVGFPLLDASKPETIPGEVLIGMIKEYEALYAGQKTPPPPSQKAPTTQPTSTTQSDIDAKKADIEEKLKRFTKTLNEFKDLKILTTEERNVLKGKLKAAIDSLPNDMHYYLHETSADVGSKIFNEGLLLGGNNLVSTAGGVSKTDLYNVLSDLIDGNIHHKGAQGAAILAFPHSEFGVNTAENKVSSQTIEAKIEDEYGAINKIPSKYVIGFFADGVLNTESQEELNAELKALEQSTSQQQTPSQDLAEDFTKVDYIISSEHLNRLSETDAPKVVLTADEYNLLVSKIKGAGTILKVNLSQSQFDILGSMATEPTNVIVDKVQFVTDLGLPTQPTGAFTIPIDINQKDEQGEPVIYYTDKEELKVFLEQDKGSLYILNLSITSEVTESEFAAIMKLESKANTLINKLELGQEEALLQQILEMYILEGVEPNEVELEQRINQKAAELLSGRTVKDFEVGSSWKLKGSNSVWIVEKVTKNQVTFTDGTSTKKVNASDLKTKVLQKVDIETMEEEEVVQTTPEEQERAEGTQEEFNSLNKDEKDAAAEKGIAEAKNKIAAGTKPDRKTLFSKDKLNPIC